MLSDTRYGEWASSSRASRSDRRVLRNSLQGFGLAVFCTLAGMVPALTLNVGQFPGRTLVGSSDLDDGSGNGGIAPEAGQESQTGGRRQSQEAQALFHYNRGLKFQRSGCLNQAVSEYRACLDFKKDMARAHARLGEAYVDLKQYAQASAALNRALALDPRSTDVLNAQGALFYARGQDRRAVEKWKQALEIDPSCAEASYNLGQALEREKSRSGAAGAYSMALALDPAAARSLEQMSSCSQSLAETSGHAGSRGDALAAHAEDPGAMETAGLFSGPLLRQMRDGAEEDETVVPAENAFAVAVRAVSRDRSRGQAPLPAGEGAELPSESEIGEARAGSSSILFEPAGTSSAE